MRPKRRTGSGGNRVRIIGGIHRGRRLRFPDAQGLRPTGDRVRETLFNWLQPVLGGARCLDLFAGSGALGLEAASRGAASVVMLDNAPEIVHQLRANLRLLGLDNSWVIQADALQWLESDPTAFDVVFLDPPFAADLLAPCCRRLSLGGWVRVGTRVYLEAARSAGLPPLPPAWSISHQRQAGQVVFALATVGE